MLTSDRGSGVVGMSLSCGVPCTKQSRGFFLAFSEEFDPEVAGMSKAEAADFVESKWWSIDVMEGCRESVTFVPRNIVDLLRSILSGEVPDAPIEVGL